MSASREIEDMDRVMKTARELRLMFTNNTEFRRLIQQLQSLEADHVGPSAEAPTPKRLSLPEVPWGETECECDSEMMDPELWGSLPNEILELVFARLPLPEIFNLRALSQDWNRTFTVANSMFIQACIDNTSPTMVGMITEHGYVNSFVHHAQISVILYDRKSSNWCGAITPTTEANLTVMGAGDGGLLCNLYTASDVEVEMTPTVVTVWNPLTRASRELEPVPVPDAPPYAWKSRFYPDMVQLVMAEDRSSYQVLVVGENLLWIPMYYERIAKVQKVAVVYSSQTGQWSPAEAAFRELIHGSQFRWGGLIKDNWNPQSKVDYFMAKFYLGPCAYDCAGQELHELDVSCDPCTGAPIESYAFIKDHLFVLQEHLVIEEDEDEGCFYCVCEYRCVYLGRRQFTWEKVKCHKVIDVLDYLLLLDDGEREMELHACSGFLLLVATRRNDVDDPYRTLLYDLSTCEWEEIPDLPNATMPGDLFELRWDATP